MAYALTSFGANTHNGQSVFDIAWLSLDATHIHAYVAGIEVFTFTVNSARTQVTFAAPPANGSVVTIRRETPLPLANFSVDFTPGSVLRSADLDKACTHLLYLCQEIVDGK